MVCHVSLLELHSEFLPASLRASKDNCGHCTDDRCCGNLLTTFKTMKMCSDFLKIYERLSPNTRFVGYLATLLDADIDSRRYSKRQSTNTTAD